MPTTADHMNTAFRAGITYAADVIASVTLENINESEHTQKLLLQCLKIVEDGLREATVGINPYTDIG